MSNTSFHCTSKVLNFIDTRPKDTEVKGAVKLDPNLREYLSVIDDEGVGKATTSSNAGNTTFASFDKQEQSLEEFVQLLCTQLGLKNHGKNNGGDATTLAERFSLMFDDRRRFVTERNKHTLQQGFILKLTASPTIYARYFLAQLGGGTAGRPLSADQLSIFSSLCMDPAFAEAFDAHEGIQRLSCVIEEAADWHPFFDSNDSGSMLLGLMHSLLQLMQLFPQLVPWQSLSAQFVRKIAFFVNGQSKLEQNDSRALALDTLLALTEHCEHLHECLKRDIPVDSLIRHLDNTDHRVLLGSLALINGLYALADREERIGIVKTLHQRPFIAAISRVLAREGPPPSSSSNANGQLSGKNGGTTSPATAAHSEQKNQLWEQIARLQYIRFDEIRSLALRASSDKEIEILKKLAEFNATASRPQSANFPMVEEEFVMDVEQDICYRNVQQAKREQQNVMAADWLAFQILAQTPPPGLLAVCAILNITQPPQTQQQDEQTTVMASSSNQAWAKLQELDAAFIGRPSLFPQLLAKLVLILIQVLGICGNSTVGQRFGIARQPRFWRIVFKCEQPFYDLFRILVELFNRTWRDMNAKPEELNKVLSVVQDQLERAMVEDPNTLEELEVEMLRKRFSYFNMQKIWKREQLEQEELELNSEDIQPLRDHLRPKFEQLVLQGRISLLKKGMNFQRILPTATGKHKESSPSSPGAAMAALSSSTAVHSSPVHSGGYSNMQHQPQYLFWRLDDRAKHFHFWDCRLSGGRPTEMMLDTQDKLPIAQIRSLLHGPELVARLNQQHGLKLHKKGQNILRCGFALETLSPQQPEFFLCAQSEQELANWLEALQCLCWPQQALQIANLRAEIDQLLGLEVHIRLMDIPKLAQKPEVPELPTDLAWVEAAFKAIKDEAL